MKTVYLFRHAHAEHPGPAMDDHDRPLSARGEAEAENAGAFFKEQGIAPDLVLCSSSLRTVQTLKLALAALDAQSEVQSRFERKFYLAARETLLDEIQEADDAFSRLMIVGHNPGMGELAEKLCAATGEEIMGFPPAAFAAFTCDVESWEDFKPKHAKLALVYMP
ncbi:MAG: hypothetical protein GC185_08700 [Alphaproteobacteria bacterium]|nr:hypothetical protein [Alphaproteobacteria bacterium]